MLKATGPLSIVLLASTRPFNDAPPCAGGETADEEQLALRRPISAYNTDSSTHGFANATCEKLKRPLNS